MSLLIILLPSILSDLKLSDVYGRCNKLIIYQCPLIVPTILIAITYIVLKGIWDI